MRHIESILVRPGETTPNVLRAKKRRRKNRQLRAKEDRGEASRLGISVSELRFRRQREVRMVIVNHKQAHELWLSHNSTSRYSW